MLEEPLLGPVPEECLDALRTRGWDVVAIGTSAEGRALHGLQVGDSDRPLVSIVAGAHPDEPAGPLAALQFAAAWPEHPLLDRIRLAIIPIIDVDGTAAQTGWLADWQGRADPLAYLQHALRRQPGEDREFAWPGSPWHGQVLPECAAAAAFLDGHGPAIAHLSLHGMAIAEGAWYLLDRLAMRDAQLWTDLRASARDLDLALHEFVRHGDKGFRRAGLGFCTTPAGSAMRRFFLQQGDSATAKGFGWSSMESARDRARKAGAPLPLCAVSELPMFTSPPAARGQVSGRRLREALLSKTPAEIGAHLQELGIRPLAMRTQTQAMCGMVTAVIQAGLRHHERSPGR